MITQCNHTSATLCGSCKEKNYQEEMKKEYKIQNTKLIKAIMLLQEILTMQDGDIRNTTKKIEQFLKENAI